MVKTNKSEEELEEESTESTSEEEQEVETEEEIESEEESEEEESEEEEEPEETVLLSDFTRTKDVLHRLADKVVGNEDKLRELYEEDPKLLERLKAEFPKKFKDVKMSTKEITNDDIDAKIKAAVAASKKSSSKDDALDALRTQLGMTPMEFLDIKDTLSEKAERYMDIEVVDNSKDAVLMAFNSLDPKKYKEVLQKEAAKELAKIKRNSKTGSVKSGETKEYSKNVLDNYKKLGFKDPAEMVKYQGDSEPIDITDYMQS